MGQFSSPPILSDDLAPKLSLCYQETWCQHRSFSDLTLFLFRSIISVNSYFSEDVVVLIHVKP